MIYNLPYTPEFNPIESIFNKLKIEFKKLDHKNIYNDIKKYLNKICKKDIINIINHRLKFINKSFNFKNILNLNISLNFFILNAFNINLKILRKK
jgi:hypothetical protein